MCGALTIIAEVVPGEMFGEVFACAGVDKMPVSIYSAEKTTVMLIDFNKLLTTCSNSCPFHSKVIQNLLKIVSQKALTLNRRIDIISKRSIRDKLMCYLIMESNQSGQKVRADNLRKQKAHGRFWQEPLDSVNVFPCGIH